MSVMGIGGRSAYAYDTPANRLIGRGGKEDAFARYLDEESSESSDGEKTSYTRHMSNGKKQSYLTFYEKDRIRCIRADKKGFDWELPFTDESQGERVREFLSGFEDKDNLPFTYHENFWRDFLSGELNVEEFKQFFSSNVSREGGQTGCVEIADDGRVLNADGAKYSKYMEPPDFVNDIFYSSEEFFRWHKAEADRKFEDLEKANPNWVSKFYQENPDMVGKKCHYYQGKWYTTEEIHEIWMEEARRLYGQYRFNTDGL